MQNNSKTGMLDYATFSKHKNNFEWVKGMYRDGMIDRDVAEKIGISLRTLYIWKSEHLEFAAVCDEGREAADYSVESALYRRATGFKYQERRIIKKNGEVIQEEIFEKSALPDATACAVWLNNRRPDKWKRDTARHNDIEGNNAITVNVINSRDEAEKIRIKKNSDNDTDRKREKKKAVEENGNKDK